jgi:hypothetical protein
MTYSYKIILKNNREYEIESNLGINEFLSSIIPKTANEYRFCHFNMLGEGDKIVTFLGSEVSNIEYTGHITYDK